MQVSTSQFYDRSTSLMAKLTQRADSLQTQIATTKRLSAPSDDAVAFQRLDLIKQRGANDVAWGKNIGMAQSVVSQADSTLTAIEAQMQRVSELAIDANSGTKSNADLKVISSELKTILDTLVTLANTTDARGQPLFGTATGASAVTRAADGTVSFEGTGSPAPIPIGDGVEIHPSETAERILGGLSTPSGTSDVFAMIKTFTAALDGGGTVTAAASAAGDGMRAALEQVNTVRASIGARGARLDLEESQLKDTAEVREIDRSSLEDTDIPGAMVELQKTLTVLDATQASFSKLSQLSLFNYLS